MSVTYNIHPAFAVDDASLLETDLTTCQLLVLIGRGIFSYVVYEPASKRFVALKSYTFLSQKSGAVADLEMIEQVFDADKLLFTSFRAVYLAFDGGDSTLVPEKHYNASLKKDYLQLIYPEKTQEVILADILPDQHLVNIYGVDKDLLGYLRKEFSTDNTLHVNSALLKSYTFDNGFRDINGVAFIDIQQHKFTLTVYKLGQLLSQQEILCQTGLDVVYHLVNALRQTGLDEQYAKVKVGGAVTADSQIYKELHRFIPKLEWMERLPGFGYIPKMQEIPGYYFNNLYALALCV
ncbi:Protein of unknown function [Chitinophaga sp. CF118]|uniref:DUF3822 family protein n=1 Tax=Chitinophaga sp. CF118 TaxID=1884367 RepID=UPI0008E90AD1|nr:DUF3822 family protein [Chitinophaga sp. CF118]SFE87092.1 Protein of unknown function [Chitinophaga sp. CF118]